MTLVQAFLVGLAATVVLLVLVIVTGLRERRFPHLALVLVYFVALGITIVLAARMGRVLDLEAAGPITAVHLGIAKATTVLYLLPIATGFLTLRDERWRRRHKRCAWALVVLTLLAVATGAWMTLAAPPL